MTFRMWFGKERWVVTSAKNEDDALKQLRPRQRKHVTKVEQVYPSSYWQNGGKW